MGEPEELLIEAARVAVAGARDLWWRGRSRGPVPELALGQVRPRLELFLAALYGRRVPIFPADPPPPPTWLARLLARGPGRPPSREPATATDGRHIWLPRALEAHHGEAAALDRYRLLAIEQAARIAHGFAHTYPYDASRIERDLYWVATAAALDHGLERELPGLAAALSAARAAALAARPPLTRLTESERAIERLVRDALAPLPSGAMAGIRTPDEAWAWARGRACDLRTAGRYRGVAPVALWGEPTPPVTVIGSRFAPAAPPETLRPGQTSVLRRRPRARPTRDDEDNTSPGMWMVRLDDPMESVEDPRGLQRPADHDDSVDAGALGDALADLPEARIVRAPGSSREVLQSDAPPVDGIPGDGIPQGTAAGFSYPEWDHRRAGYRFPGAIVRPMAAAEAGIEWAHGVLERRATLARQVRRRFEGLRPRRTRLGRQPDGADVDLDAYVTAFADRRAGQPGDDRLYSTSRPVRRDLTVAVLVDVSASTDAWVSGGLRIVDVEKEALVILLEALDVLGDRHAMLAFSGEGPRAVRVVAVKGFDETSRAAAQRRIAALEPDGYTRVGAALRHASALLGRESARHRLLLLLSDGKPNDVDEYAGRYGIEDTRQAVAEARLQGLVPFCLTVDREAPSYLPTIFGPRGYAVLSRPELFPSALVEVLRSLVTS